MAIKKDLNPFGGDDETDAKTEAPEKEKNPDDVEIALAEPAAKDEEDDDEPAVDDEPGATRKEKKRNRYRENIEAREKAEKAAEEANARASAAQAQVAQALEQARQAIELARQQGNGAGKHTHTDPLDEAESKLNEERVNLYREYQARNSDKNNPLTADEQAKFKKRVQDIEDRKIDVRSERKFLARQAQMQQQHQPDPQLVAIQAHLAMRFPEIAASQQAQLYADGERRRLIARGKPNDLSTVEEALETTARDLRMGKYKEQRKADLSLRDKLTGPSKGAAGGTAEMPKSIVMTRDLQKLADKAYSHIKDPAKRYEMWAKTTGAELLAEGVNLSEYRANRV